jgi:hypothetical protein
MSSRSVMLRNSIRPGLGLGITPETLSLGAAGLTVATSNFSGWPKTAAAARQEHIANRRGPIVTSSIMPPSRPREVTPGLSFLRSVAPNARNLNGATKY